MFFIFRICLKRERVREREKRKGDDGPRKTKKMVGDRES